MFTTGILLLPALITFLYYLSTGKRYRWVYILAKTFSRDVKALMRFPMVLLYLIYWEQTNQSIPKILKTVTKKNPAKVALFFEEEKWTYQELEDYTNRVANYFKDKGLKKGDAVALLLENRPEYVGLWVGLSKIGVVTALINTNLISDSLIHCIMTVNCKVLIYGSDFQKAVSDIRSKLPDTKLYEYKTKEAQTLEETVELNAELSKQPSTSPDELENVKPTDRAIYIYTSGTTGLPKAAVISHIKYMYTTAGLHCMLALNANDVLYNPLPLYHGAGGMVGIGQSLLFGTPVVIRKKFSASAYWVDCKKYHCTVAQYIGELCRFLLVAHKPGNPVDHPVKKMSGNGLRPEIWKKFQDTFKIQEIYEFYGSTEGNLHLVNLDGTVGAVGFIPRQFSWLYPGLIVKCDEDTGEPIRNKDGFLSRCRPGEAGLLIGKISNKMTANAFLGYADKKATKKKIFVDAFKKGDMYFNSGDILVQDELGYIYFKDRTGDTFRWKGENVAANEVEATISKIVGLKQTVVYGVEIPNVEGKAGMAVIADPHKQLDIEKLGKLLKSNLPIYALPLFLRVLDSVPITGTYKFQKVDLKKEGYNIDVVKDNLYFFDIKSTQYVPLTSQLYENIISGKVRV